MKIGRIDSIEPFEVKSRRTGEVYTLCRSLTNGSGLRGLSVICEEIPPHGRASAPHSHSLKDEIHIVLKGEVIANCDGKEERLREGDFVVFEGGVHELHFLSNRTDATALVLTVASSPASDIIHYEERREASV